MRMLSRILPITLIGLFAIGAPAFGAPPASSTHAGPYSTNLFGLEGLFFSTTGTALPAGTMLVGGSFLLLNDNDTDSDAQSIPLTFTYGLDGRFDLALAFEVYRSVDYPGFDDSGVSTFTLRRNTPFSPAPPSIRRQPWARA